MMLLLRELQQDVADRCFVCASASHIPAYRSCVVSQIISVITNYIHISSSYTWYAQEIMRFLQHIAKPQCWTHGHMNYHFSVHETTINDVFIAYNVTRSRQWVFCFLVEIERSCSL